MQRPYLLPRESNAIAITSLRHHSHIVPLKVSDPAVRAMTDFQREPMLTVSEELELEQVLDEMFRVGVRALLVVRERVVIGLITAEHARGERGFAPSSGRRVGDVMTSATEVPAVDWGMIEAARVRDLIEIFEGSGAQHLVVLENETANRSSVRGLIHRDRLERQLGSRWAMRPDRSYELR